MKDNIKEINNKLNQQKQLIDDYTTTIQEYSYK